MEVGRLKEDREITMGVSENYFLAMRNRPIGDKTWRKMSDNPSAIDEAAKKPSIRYIQEWIGRAAAEEKIKIAQ